MEQWFDQAELEASVAEWWHKNHPNYKPPTGGSRRVWDDDWEYKHRGDLVPCKTIVDFNGARVMVPDVMLAPRDPNLMEIDRERRLYDERQF